MFTDPRLPSLVETLAELTCTFETHVRAVVDGAIGCSMRAGCEDHICSIGWSVVHSRWQRHEIGTALMEHEHIEVHFPHADRFHLVTVASRFGTLTLARQICSQPPTQTHLIPGNAVLPAHNGIIITRGLQEWACLLPQELPFAAVARLLGWQTHDDAIRSDTTIRSLVRMHGQLIRQVEQAEGAALVTRDDLASLELTLVPHDQPRRCAGWPAELNAAVPAAR